MQRGVAVPCVHLGRRAGVDLVFLPELLPANLGISVEFRPPSVANTYEQWRDPE
ncbi:HAD superfamily hydrolase [Aspergillus luchuensis]|uniref:HAD superfamily hydrolase n=1 Tax=Aspergillus kawachii TaxID=1069201 RepID=A0A146F6H8_ASPKA|nr:HAD superfamily hydrolase [Aspergillus luchuensis]